jgi:hypothetical protein
MKKIEFVCLGNNGRSPILETVVKDQAIKMRLDEEVQITSSGRYVNNRHPFDLLLSTMKKHLDSPHMQIYGTEQDKVKTMIADPDIKQKYENDSQFRKQFLYYFDQVYRPLQAMDVAFRNNVLARHGLNYESERYQFPSQEGLDYIFTTTNLLVEPVKELMINDNPIITSVGKAANIKDLKGGFGKFDITFYERLYQGAKKAAPIILERVMENDVD